MTEGMPAKRVSLHTLGCKLNYAETSTIAGDFVRSGYSVVPFGQDTDLLVLNTCSVTENAEKECRQLIRRTLRQSPSAKVVVTGCYAQLRPNEIAAISGVSMVLGSKEKVDVVQRVESNEWIGDPLVAISDIAEENEFHGATSFEGAGRTRAFLKVQDGCDYTCSYCTIPKARGASRSGSIEEIVERARELCAEGFQEIVITGVNVGDFGRDGDSSFLDLALALESDPDVTARLRISSIEPNLLTDEVIELVADSGKFCPHFHVPLQSGSARVLRLMQRRYQPALYRNRIEKTKRLMPHACIGADVIVGFPGESDSDFQDTIGFIESVDLSYLHVFTYSERPGTKAESMTGSVPIEVRRERNRILRLLSEKKRRQFEASQIGREVNVILEHNGEREGYSENYVRAQVAGDLPPDTDLVRVRLTGSRSGKMIGELVEVLSYKGLPILQAA